MAYQMRGPGQHQRQAPPTNLRHAGLFKPGPPTLQTPCRTLWTPHGPVNCDEPTLRTAASPMLEAVLARTAAPEEVQAVLARTAAHPLVPMTSGRSDEDAKLREALDRDEATALVEIEEDDIVPFYLDTELAQGRLVGEGTFGRVSLVTIPCGGEAAYKQPKVQPGDDVGTSVYMRMEQVHFLYEVRNAMQLARAGEFPLLGVVTDKTGRPTGYLMEYCPAGALDELVWNSRLRMTTQEIVGILHRTAQCVANMHEAFPEARWAHRDIKPGNFLLRGPRPSPEAPLLLADLGMAGNFDGLLGSWMGWSVRGTPGFAPWELSEGGVGCGKADVYSLGVTFLWILNPRVRMGEGLKPHWGPSLPLPQRLGAKLEDLVANMTASFPYMRPDSRTVERALAGLVAQL